MLEDDELFDVTQFEQTLISLIEKGKRNLAVDLSKIDYLYSDSINKLINLNHRILNVYGRLAILSPSPQVYQILHRAGIHNFIKIYADGNELMRASSEIIQQTTAINVKDIHAYATKQEPPQKESEFQDLKQELEGTGQSELLAQPDQFFNQNQDTSFASNQYFAQPQQQMNPQYPQAPETQFQYGQQQNPPFYPPFAAQQPVQPIQPAQPQPVQQPADFFNAMPSFNAQQQAPVQQPPTNFQQPAYQEQSDQEDSLEEKTFDDFQHTEIESPGSEKFTDDDAFEDNFDNDGAGKKKNKNVFVLVGVLAVVALVSVGAIYIFKAISLKNSIKQLPFKTPFSETQQQPPVPVATPTPQPPQPVTQVVPPTPVQETQPQPVQSEPAVTPAKSPRKEPTQRAPRVSNRTAQPSERRQADKIVITSFPSNATITSNGQVIGKTPFTWNSPESTGPISLDIEKDGYTPKNATIDYNGGEMKKHFILVKQTARQTTESSSLSNQSSSSKSSMTDDFNTDLSTPPPSSSKPPAKTSSPSLDLEDDFSNIGGTDIGSADLEPPTETKKSSKTRPEPSRPSSTLSSEDDLLSPPSSSSQSSSSGSSDEEAVIFISSLPPMADVFLDGQKIGKTNVAELKLPPGTHNLKFVKGDKEVTKQLTLISGKNPSQLIRLK